MRDLTLDEAIKQQEAIAAEQRELYGLCPCPCNGLTDCKCLESGKDKGCMKLHYEHQQLADWLTELKALREENKVLTSECDRLIKEKGELLKKSEQIAEYKRLLDLAHHDLKTESICRNCKYQQTGLDNVCNGCRGNRYEWRYADEFKKLYDPITEAVDKIYDRLGIGQTSEITASEIAKMSYEYQEPKEYSGLISE